MQNLVYKIARPILFSMDPERSHTIALSLGRFLPSTQIHMPVKLLGMDFPNPLGVAAGFDKNGEHISTISKMGFGFVEVGSVTPLPQAGNAKPRIKRLTHHDALINRMGLNNLGVEVLAKNLEKRSSRLIVGAGFTKNTHTHFDLAVTDYQLCMERLYPVSNYLVADVSCPNTGELDKNSNLEFLETLCAQLKEKQKQLHFRYERYVPFLLKLSCDWGWDFLKPLSVILGRYSIDGLVCGNTIAGLSGRPLFPKALRLVKTMRELLGGKIPIIGVGGIFDRQDLLCMRKEGAELFQIYTALVYKGPQIVSELLS